jgi:peptidoglycan hydrolase CwlO-like protein
MSEPITPIQLHDRATRGLPLTEAERTRLEAWYAEQDAEESLTLKAQPAPMVGYLNEQISGTLRQLQEMTARIQTLTSENEALRQEIADLQRQLTQTQKVQPV